MRRQVLLSGEVCQRLHRQWPEGRKAGSSPGSREWGEVIPSAGKYPGTPKRRKGCALGWKPSARKCNHPNVFRFLGRAGDFNSQQSLQRHIDQEVELQSHCSKLLTNHLKCQELGPSGWGLLAWQRGRGNRTPQL